MAEQTEGVLSGGASGAATGAAVGAFGGPITILGGALIGGALGVLGGFFGGKKKKKARKAKRKARAARVALSGLQATRARRRLIRDAIRARSQIVSQSTLAGVSGSGVSGALSGVATQLQTELGFAATSKQLSDRAGIFETKAAKFTSQAASISAFTGLALSAFSTFGGASASGGSSGGIDPLDEGANAFTSDFGGNR